MLLRDPLALPACITTSMPQTKCGRCFIHRERLYALNTGLPKDFLVPPLQRILEGLFCVQEKGEAEMREVWMSGEAGMIGDTEMSEYTAMSGYSEMSGDTEISGEVGVRVEAEMNGEAGMRGNSAMRG